MDEVGYWNGMVLNVAHGMIATTAEVMHILMLGPPDVIFGTEETLGSVTMAIVITEHSGF
jgi:hypothetical protein